MAEMPAPDAPLVFDPALPPSSSLLCYLFAERMMPKARWGTKAPLSEVHVSTSQLATTLFAVALWYLREFRLVRLELAQERHFLKTTTYLRVTRTEADAAGSFDGIEGGLLDLLTRGGLSRMTPAWERTPRWVKDRATTMAQTMLGRMQSMLATHPELANRPEFANLANVSHLSDLSDLSRISGNKTVPATVVEVIGHWYGSSMSSPEGLPIEWTEREGVAKGYLMEVDANRNPIMGALLGKTTHVPQRERIAALEPTFAQLLAHWQAFQANEAALAGQLLTDVAAGIESRRQRTESSDGGG